MAYDPQKILNNIWSWFRILVKYILIYLVAYAVLKLLLFELLNLKNLSLITLLSAGIVLAVYFLQKR